MSIGAKVFVSLLAGSLVVGGGGCAVEVGHDGVTDQGTREEALVASKRQPAPTAATYKVMAKGSVKLVVRGTFRTAEVKFRSSHNRTRLLVKKLAQGHVKFVLPAGTHKIKARAKATPKRGASLWVRATAARTPVAPPTSAPPTADPKPSTGAGLTAEDLTAVARLKTFFGHQSVGGNILKAVPLVYANFDLRAPQILEEPAMLSGGGLLHAEVGRNGEPLTKLSEFAASIRGGIGKEYDVAFMKFCYVDITAKTNVEALFASYKNELADLQREYPGLAFLHFTVPLTTDSPADNVKREQYNALLRNQYADSGRLFDLAAIESTRPDGTRVTGSYGGTKYYALYDGYASDNGHLNTQGAKAVAAGMLDVVAANAG